MQREKLTFYVRDLAEAVTWYIRELKREPAYVAKDEACFSTEYADLRLILEKVARDEAGELIWSRPVHFSNFDFFSPSPSA